MIGKEGVSLILVLLVVFSPYLIITEENTPRINDTTSIETKHYHSSEVEYNSSVEILADGDFVVQGWPGNGTESSPYLISNLRFISRDVWPIIIYHTRAHFVINNCVVEPTDVSLGARWGKGILLSNVTNGVVENCTIHDMNAGVYISDANNTIVRNNLIIACDTAISIHRIERCTFSNNSIRMGYEGISTYKLRNSNLTGNMIVESYTGLGLSPETMNNTISQNRIGWCTEVNAFDTGSGNIWDGNSWSDWDEVGPYLISGRAGSIDESPTLFDEDVLGPTIEFNYQGGVIADLLEPIYSYTFSATVTDATGVDSVSLFKCNGYLIEDGRLVQSIWIEYNMEHQPIEGNPNRYSYTFDCNGTFGATYYFWTNDTLGFSRRSEIDSFSIGYFPWGPSSTVNPPSLNPGVLLLLPLGALIVILLFRRIRSRT